MKRLASAVVVAGLAASAAGVEVGSPAPDVSARSSAGETVRLADLKGSWVVVYFYPKSFTPGCTKEACSLRDGHADIEKLGAKVFGVSFDAVETQKKFREEHKLPFEILSDADKSFARGFDAVGLGGLMPQRKTFIIDPQGKVARIIDAVNVGDHDAQVRQALEELQKPPAP
jgi:peroxiredoxin Q/BCP